MTWLEDILGQLALEHPHYGTGYDAVTNYLTLATSDARPPFYFAKYLIEDLRLRDDYHQESRDKTVPPSATQVYGIAQQLQPMVRWARFLGPDGITRLEVYWTMDEEQLRPRRRLVNRLRREGHNPSEDYLMVVTAAIRNMDYSPNTLRQRFYRLPASMTGAMPVHTWETDLDGDMQHLAMQWQQYWAERTDDGRYEPRATLGIGVMTMDSVMALRSDGRELEMSDIRPVVAPEFGNVRRLVPYAGREITSTTSLGMYFELYNLAYDNDEKTRYEVAYTIRNEGGDTPITASTTYEGSSRVAQEEIVIDLSAWGASGPITITVQATDLVLGVSKSRSVEFEYRP